VRCSGALFASAKYIAGGQWHFVGRIPNPPNLLESWYRLTLNAQEAVLEDLARGRVPDRPIFSVATIVPTALPSSLVLPKIHMFTRASSVTRPSPPRTPSRRSAPLSPQPRCEPSADDDLSSLNTLSLADPFMERDDGDQAEKREVEGSYIMFGIPSLGPGRVA
jgi:hypothetical protein